MVETWVVGVGLLLANMKPWVKCDMPASIVSRRAVAVGKCPTIGVVLWLTAHCAVAIAAPQQPPHYSIVDLGPVNLTLHINDHGTIVGASRGAAYLWSPE